MKGYNQEEKRKRITQIILGFFFLILGAFFMVIPFIPLGYLFLLIGLFFLSPIIPWINRLLENAEKRDRKGRVRKARGKSEKISRKIEKGISRRR